MPDHLRPLAPATSAAQPSPSDEELLARMDRGDRRAMGTLYGRYVDVLRRIGMAILRSETEAEDAVHDVFVKLGMRSGQYDPRFGSARSWLSAATRNACIDRYRRTARHRHAANDVAIALRPHEDQDYGVLLRALDGQRAMQALHALPPVQRRTIESLYCEDMSCSELARHDRMPLGTVKSRAARALRTLRLDLAGQEGPEKAMGEAA